MAMSVTYTTIHGRIVHENRVNVERFYLPDPLGNTAGLVDASGAVTDTWNYWPYGEVQSHGGTSTTPFTFVGTRGYFLDFANHIYVRTRHNRADLARWLTVDGRWPRKRAYGYTRGAPTNAIDPSGLDEVLDVLIAVAVTNVEDPVGWGAAIGIGCITLVGAFATHPIHFDLPRTVDREPYIDPPMTQEDPRDWDCGPRCDLYCKEQGVTLWGICVDTCTADCLMTGGYFPPPPGSGSFGRTGPHPYPNPWWGITPSL